MAINTINISSGRVVESFNGLTGHVTKQIFKYAEYDEGNPYQMNFLDENNALIDSIILDASNVQNLPALDQDNKFRIIAIPPESLTTQDEAGVAEYLNVGLTISDKEVIIVRIIGGDKFFLTGLGKGTYGGVNTLITTANLLKFDAIQGVSSDANQALTIGVDGKPFLDKALFGTIGKDGVIYFNEGYQGGLEFLWTARWVFADVLYELNQNPQTAAAADATYDRIDVFALNSDGTGSIITGIPAANPVEPSIDPLTQLRAAIIIVKAGATTPDGVTTIKVYDENAQIAGGEYNTAIVPSSTRLVLNSTTRFRQGSVSIEGTNLALYDSVEFTAPSPVLVSELNTLGLSLYIKAGSYNKHKGDAYRVQLIGMDAGGNTVNVYLTNDPSFDIFNWNSWQNLSFIIPKDTLLVSITKIKFISWVSSGLNFGFWLDNIFIVKGTSNLQLEDYATIEYVDQQDALRADIRLSNIVGDLTEDEKTTIKNKIGIVEGGADKNYYHDQGVASATWIISHNLQKFPTPHVLDTAGNEVEGKVTHTDINNLTIEFNAAFSGSATLN